MKVTHRTAEERSLALHSEVARRLRRDPSLLETARRRVRSWLQSGAVPRRSAEAWERVLAGSPEDVASFLVDPGEPARALRQSSPFAGALDPRTRWQILRGWREAEP